MGSEILFFILALICSAFFSGVEMAFVTANEFKIRDDADEGNPSAQAILRLKSKSQVVLTSLLIGNNIAHVAATAIMAYAFQTHLGISSEWLVTIVTVPLFMIFAEMLPKDYCRLHSDTVVLSTSMLLHWVVMVLQTPAGLFLKSVHYFLKRLNLQEDKNIFVSEKEFRTLIEESTRSGVLGQHERQLINTILDFERVRVGSAMVPILQAPKVDITATVGEMKVIAQKTGSKMILVYEEIPSLIVGMVYVFDLLFETDLNQGVKKYLRSPVFVSEQTSLEKAFMMLQQRRQSFAVVIDHYHEAQGVVSIEDLLSV